MSSFKSSSLIKLFLVLFVSSMLFACGRSVTRVNANSVTDLSGRWNDTDSRLVAQEMVQDVLSRPWLNRFTRSHHGKPPTVIVGEVRNLSHEHINTRTFIANIERELINSGDVNFVASSGERQEIRSERKDQDVNASEATRKAMGQEIGADFMLQGSINSIVDAVSGEQARYYQVDLTLIDMANNRKVWIGEKKIKKTIEKSMFRL